MRIVNCAEHGERSATLTCQHIAQSLLSGVPVGFHWSSEDSSPRPDAWCTDCNRLLMQDPNGEWTDEALERASLKVLCAGCYEEAAALCFGTSLWRTRFNWPEPATGTN
jgi:hypothetical protein